ncbi:MAG TPA: alpha-glucuronidase family glycosyl hydrolase, partial [Steroidobacteraceae bacterium]
MNHRPLLAGLAAALFALPAVAEDGYDLWLRYRPPGASTVSELVGGAASPTLEAAQHELVRGLGGLAGAPVPVVPEPGRAGALLFGTPRSSASIASLSLGLERAGAEGYVIRSTTLGGRPVTVIAANSDVGVLYGSFHFLRLLQTGQGSAALDLVSQPRTRLRVLDHWDNLDRHVERGYSGESIWDWHKLPGWLDPRYTDYARACASIGINGAVLTNVNANATSLTPAYLEKAAALAQVFRPYGVRVYLTARFSAPIELGGLKTA